MKRRSILLTGAAATLALPAMAVWQSGADIDDGSGGEYHLGSKNVLKTFDF